MKNDLDSIELYQARAKSLKFDFPLMRTTGYRSKFRITKRFYRTNFPLRSKFAAERGVGQFIVKISTIFFKKQIYG